jgi:hypothetical protein
MSAMVSLLTVVDLGSLSPFVYRSLVTPDKFRVRVVMVPPHAGLLLFR